MTDSVKTEFPFRPLNGYIVITDDRGTTDPRMGTVLAVCQSLAGQIFTGDRVLYGGGYDCKKISFGKARGILVNVQALYGVWDIQKCNEVFAQIAPEGKINKETTFEI